MTFTNRGSFWAHPPCTQFRLRPAFVSVEVVRQVTDGPFTETREQLGGYFLIDAANLDDAIDIAGRVPAAQKGTVEVRPVVELAGLPSVG